MRWGAPPAEPLEAPLMRAAGRRARAARTCPACRLVAAWLANAPAERTTRSAVPPTSVAASAAAAPGPGAKASAAGAAAAARAAAAVALATPASADSGFAAALGRSLCWTCACVAACCQQQNQPQPSVYCSAARLPVQDNMQTTGQPARWPHVTAAKNSDARPKRNRLLLFH